MWLLMIANYKRLQFFVSDFFIFCIYCCWLGYILTWNCLGVLQPVKEIAKAIQQYNITSQRRIYLHTDAAQAIGKIPVCVQDLGVDYLTIVGHKFYGPRIGALYIRGLSNGGSPLRPLILGGGQEKGYRAGTENTAMIAGLGRACELVTNNVLSYQSQLLEVRNHLESRLNERFQSQIVYNGKSDNSERLPNTCNFSIIGDEFEGKKILKNCKRVVAGVGAACHSAHSGGASVLIASGVSREMAMNAIRLSVGKDTTIEDIDSAVEDICNAVQIIAEQVNPSVLCLDK